MTIITQWRGTWWVLRPLVLSFSASFLPVPQGSSTKDTLSQVFLDVTSTSWHTPASLGCHNTLLKLITVYRSTLNIEKFNCSSQMQRFKSCSNNVCSQTCMVIWKLLISFTLLYETTLWLSFISDRKKWLFSAILLPYTSPLPHSFPIKNKLFTAGVSLRKTFRSLKLLLTSFFAPRTWLVKCWLAAYAQSTPMLQKIQIKYL